MRNGVNKGVGFVGKSRGQSASLRFVIMLNVTKVDHIYSDGTAALDKVSLSLPAGSFVSLVGQSGVGKSTLLRIMAGLLTPTRGAVTGKHKPNEIGIVFQQHNLMPWRTAYQNIKLPLEVQGMGELKGSADSQDEQVQALIDLVGLTGFEGSFPSQLSGGMAQRVALARALVHKPQLLFLDEPFGALDTITRERMGNELQRIWLANPVTVFMVTHSIAEAVLLSDEVLVMGARPGSIIGRYPINLPRPRTINALTTDPDIQSTIQEIRLAIAGV